MASKAKRQGFELTEFVTSCSTCMGKEGLLEKPAVKPGNKQVQK